MKMEVGCFRVCGTSEHFRIDFSSVAVSAAHVVEADGQICGGVVLSESIGDMMQVMFLCRA